MTVQELIIELCKVRNQNSPVMVCTQLATEMESCEVDGLHDYTFSAHELEVDGTEQMNLEDYRDACVWLEWKGARDAG